MVSTILITRHGYRANWDDPSKVSCPTEIIGDVELSEHGLEQAEELAQHIVSSEPDIDLILSSPFYRCLQTATPVSGQLSKPICAETGIGEWFKPERSTRPVPASSTRLAQWFPNIDTTYASLLGVNPNGETEEDIHERCAKFIQLFVKDLDENRPEIKKVLMVTHAASKIALGRALLQDSQYQLRSGTCSLDKFERDPASGAWTIVSNGATEFLTNGEEMHWTFDSKFMPGSTEEAQSRLHHSSSDTKTDTPTSIQNAASEQISVYLPLDFSQIRTTAPISKNQFQILDLHCDHPIIRQGDKTYQGSWQDMTGTEVYLQQDMHSTDNVSCIGTSRQRVVLQSVELRSKIASSQRKTPLASRLHLLTEQRKQMERNQRNETNEPIEKENANENANGESTNNDTQMEIETDQ